MPSYGKAFEFAEKEGFGCQSVEQVLSDWQGYKVFAPVWKKIFASGMPTFILEKNGVFSVKQDVECLDILDLIPYHGGETV